MTSNPTIDTTVLGTPFTFPNGTTTKNRLVKAAMSEQLATAAHSPPTAPPT